MLINVTDEEKKEDAEEIVSLSLFPHVSEDGSEEALAMLSAYDGPVNVPHTISSCERELRLQVFSEHSYSLFALCSIDPSCSIDPGCSVESSASVKPSA